MAHNEVTYTDVEPRAPGMYFLRDALDCANAGVTVIEAGAGWNGREHDHAEDGQEEVYLLLDGSATLTVEGEALSLSTGDAVRVDAADTRELSFNAADSRMVIVGAA